MGEERKVQYNDLVNFSSVLFNTAGLGKQDAYTVAACYIDNNLRGIDSHGVRLIPNCIRRLREGGINPHPEIELEAENPSTARLNGDNGLGQIVAIKGMNLAIEKAERNGIGFVVCSNTNNAGAMSSYSKMALGKGLAGLAMATTVPSMFAWGGLKRVISNPPISITFPGRKTHFVLDICLGSVAWNKIYIMRDKGFPILPGWAVDNQGENTEDPKKAADGGSVIPIGGHKGYGLTLAIELFTAILGGNLFGFDMKGLFDDPRKGEGISMSLAALNVSKLLDSNVLFERVETFFSMIKDSPLKRGVSEIMIPGEPEEKKYKVRIKEGIPIPEEVEDTLKGCCAGLGIDYPF